MTIKRGATRAAAIVLAGAGLLAGAGVQQAVAADPPGDPNFNSCDLSQKANELAGWDDQGKYNVVVWKENHRYSSVFHGVVAEGETADYDCNGRSFGKYFWKVFRSGEFTRQGDGGYRNWAFYGVWTRTGNTVTFHNR
ncbi:hypothetical protein E1263_00980 [Kribbella antibiotica]|uniref:Stress protein n=1 Tax=Kribbella antibiotica TaxID=190195 RepID=A0A4R5A155_9ACTN|nr:hypothetical protein [Kribbella antibiotica]TDD63232.1 hypothetical protein E1263_00980 [Kribbella antibiotica]